MPPHFREVERLFSPVRFHLFIVSDGSRRGYEPETIDRPPAIDTGCLRRGL